MRWRQRGHRRVLAGGGVTSAPQFGQVISATGAGSGGGALLGLRSGDDHRPGMLIGRGPAIDLGAAPPKDAANEGDRDHLRRVRVDDGNPGGPSRIPEPAYSRLTDREWASGPADPCHAPKTGHAAPPKRATQTPFGRNPPPAAPPQRHGADGRLRHPPAREPSHRELPWVGPVSRVRTTTLTRANDAADVVDPPGAERRPTSNPTRRRPRSRGAEASRPGSRRG